ncbi:MAG: MFS transporter [Deltaproteobacteria bacterium]|nr:MFS transporter [Deltaproteobacteria bacterium]
MAAPLSPTFWTVWVGALINRCGTLVVPYLAWYLSEARELGEARAGTIVALWGLGALASGPLGGLLADRIGRRPSLTLALVGGGLAMLQLGLARAPLHLAFSAFLAGILGELYRPAMNAVVADVVPLEERARAFGLIYWVVNLGMSVANSLGGLLATRGFLPLFVLDAATTFLFGIVVWVRVPETRPSGSAATSGHGGDLAAPYRDPLLLAFVLVSFLLALVFSQWLFALPLALRRAGLPPTHYGLLMAFNGVLIVLLQPGLVRWLARRDRGWVLCVGSLLTGCGFGLTALASTAWGYAATVVLWTFGEMLTLPLGPTVVADLAPPHLRASYLGLYQLSWGAASFLAPLLGGRVIARFGANVIWAACALLGLVAALGQLAVARASRRRAA